MTPKILEILYTARKKKFKMGVHSGLLTCQDWTKYSVRMIYLKESCILQNISGLICRKKKKLTKFMTGKFWNTYQLL